MTVTNSNRTLGDLPGAYKLHFNCSNAPACYFNKPMDVQRMIEHLGSEFDSISLYDVLQCPACKGRKFLVMFSPVHVSYGNLN